MRNALGEWKLKAETEKLSGLGERVEVALQQLCIFWRCCGPLSVRAALPLTGSGGKTIFMLLFHQSEVQESCFSLKLAARKV